MFALPNRFGHRLYPSEVFIFQLLILFASFSCVPCISATSQPCRKIPPNLRKFAFMALYSVQQVWFAVPCRLGHRLHRLRVSIFKLPILFASCSCALCISATSAPRRKIPPNLSKFAKTALYGVEQTGLVCSLVHVSAPFPPTVCLRISSLHPLCFMFMCTLH